MKEKVKSISMIDESKAKSIVAGLRGDDNLVWLYKTSASIVPIYLTDSLDDDSFRQRIKERAPNYATASNNIEELRKKTIKDFDRLIVASLVVQTSMFGVDSQELENYLHNRDDETLTKFAEEIK